MSRGTYDRLRWDFNYALCQYQLYFTLFRSVEYTSSDFDLWFRRDVQGYAETEFYEDLSAFTVAFWMKTSSQDIETGTVFSYAYGSEESKFVVVGIFY